MDIFDPNPPAWTYPATHALQFCCPSCRASNLKAERVWLNRRSPVFTDGYQKKWQEFYQCACGRVWWAWSSDRPTAQ